MTRLATLVLVTAFAIAGCSGGDARGTHESAHRDLNALVAIPTRIAAKTGVPAVDGTAVSGTIVNRDGKPVGCSPELFHLRDGKDDRAAVTGWCTVAAIAPGSAGEFSVTFADLPKDSASIEFAHPDGSTETQELSIPPQ